MVINGKYHSLFPQTNFGTSRLAENSDEKNAHIIQEVFGVRATAWQRRARYKSQNFGCQLR